jgi:transposase
VEKKKGEAGLNSRKAKGREPFLGIRKQRTLRKWILTKDPRDFGFSEALWSQKIVSALILNKFRIKITPFGAGKLLHRLNITPQRPLRRAYERDPQRIEEWKSKILPKICRRAKARNAVVLYLDEAGIQSDATLGSSWGEKGKTPIVATSGQRQKVNAVSAVSAKGDFKFSLYTTRFNAELFINILKNFTKGLNRPCFFILDGHPAHRAKTVSQFIQATKGKIELHFLPPYAPDLNPDEFVWQHIKQHGLSKRPLRKNESLARRVRTDLRAIGRRPDLVRSFFKARSVGYPSC